MSTTSCPAIPVGIWPDEPTHSATEFDVKHIAIATVRRESTAFEAPVEVGGDLATATASATVRAQSTSINEPQPGESPAINRIREAAKFRSWHLTQPQSRNGTTGCIARNLTVPVVTNVIVMHAAAHGTHADPWGNERAGREVTDDLSRSDYDMTFDRVLGSEKMLVADEGRSRPTPANTTAK